MRTTFVATLVMSASSEMFGDQRAGLVRGRLAVEEHRSRLDGGDFDGSVGVAHVACLALLDRSGSGSDGCGEV